MPADPIWGQLILQVILIAVNAFFAAAEIAVISLDENKLRVRAENGDKDAVRMLKLVSSPSGFLSTIQIAITLAGFLGSAFAAEHFAGPMVEALMKTNAFGSMNQNVLNTVCVILITIILSYFTLVFGELVPKRVAMQKTDAVAKVVSGVILGFSTVMKPLVWLLTVSTNGVLRLCRIDPNAQEDSVTEQDIRMMADLGEEKGSITETEGEMIDNIFEFNNHTAFDVMTHRTDVIAISADATDEEILRTIRESGLSRIPVYEKTIDDVIGILRVREYLLYRAVDDNRTLREMLHTPNFVPESVRTDVLFRSMQQKKNHIAIVVDEYGGVSGLVTMEDLLEEIVGEIRDEYDEDEVEDIKEIQPEREYVVQGSAKLDDINEALHINLESEDYDSIGGYIIEQLDCLPKEGQSVTLESGIRLVVDRLDKNRIELVHIWLPEKKTETEEQP